MELKDLNSFVTMWKGQSTSAFSKIITLRSVEVDL